MTPEPSAGGQAGSGTVTVATVASVVAGMLAIVASFLPFFTGVQAYLGAAEVSTTTWHRPMFMFLVFFFFSAAIASGLGLATRLRPSNAMVRVGSFTLFQVARALAWTSLAAGVVLFVSWIGGDVSSLSAGYWLGLVASVITVIVECFGSKIAFLNQALTSASPVAQAGWVAVAAAVTATDDTGGVFTVQPGQWLQSLGTDPSGAPVIVINGRQYRLPVGTPLHTSG